MQPAWKLDEDRFGKESRGPGAIGRVYVLRRPRVTRATRAR